MLLKILALWVFLVVQGFSETSDIINLDILNFVTAKKQFDFLLIYFYDVGCSQCKINTQIFYTLSALIKNQNNINQKIQNDLYFDVQLAEIKFVGNEDVFKQQNVEAIPEFRIYKKKEQKYYIFPSLIQTQLDIQKLQVWIQRVGSKKFLTVQSIAQIGQKKKNVVVDCRQTQIIQYITSSPSFTQNLDLNYVCLNNSNLRKGDILLKHGQYKRKLSTCLKKRQKQTTQLTQCQTYIQNFRFWGVLPWSAQIIHHIYSGTFFQNIGKFEVLVLVASNETISQIYTREIQQIKKNLDEKDKGLLPIFTIANIHYDLQSTIRIKKFIGGYDIKGWPYPYPLLAFLRLDDKGEIFKSLYEQKYSEKWKSPYTISQWLQKAMAHELPRDYRSQYAYKELDLLENNQQRTIYKIYLSQLEQLIKKYTITNSPSKTPVIFLYVLWRANWAMQVISSRMKKWWASVRYQALFFNFDLFDNDMPQGTSVSDLPALVVYYSDASIKVHQGIETEKKIKQIIEQSFKQENPS